MRCVPALFSAGIACSRLSAFSKNGALLAGQRFSSRRLPPFRPGDNQTPVRHHRVKNEFEPLAILHRRQTGAGRRIETSERLWALLHCCFSVLVVLVEIEAELIRLCSAAESSAGTPHVGARVVDRHGQPSE